MYVENRIQEIRKLNNISQIDMAKSLSVSRQTISAIENSKYNPSLELIYNINRLRYGIFGVQKFLSPIVVSLVLSALLLIGIM